LTPNEKVNKIKSTEGVITYGQKSEGKTMKYGYARVSTKGQDLQAQINALEKEGCKKIFFEKITGTKVERTEFQKVIEMLAEGDTLTVTKLDRFARSTSDALSIVKDLFNRGVKVHVLNMGIIENTPTGRLIFTIFSAFAEFERDLIVSRTQEGKEIAKQREDFREGRPKKFSKKQIQHALELLRDHSYKQVEEITGISKSTLIRAKREN
jgi:DNA invertase Pin-like site-specific DNA recombinase